MSCVQLLFKGRKKRIATSNDGAVQINIGYEINMIGVADTSTAGIAIPARHEQAVKEPDSGWAREPASPRQIYAMF
ncbi:hypothetical protein RHS03_04446, partial [Rhizoctonia solani]